MLSLVKTVNLNFNLMHDPLSKPGTFLGGFSATLNATRTGLESLTQEIKIFFLSFKTIYDYRPDFAAFSIFFSVYASYETPMHGKLPLVISTFRGKVC